VKQFWVVFDKLLMQWLCWPGIILIFMCACCLLTWTIGYALFCSIRLLYGLHKQTEYALCWIVFLATTWLLREGDTLRPDIIYGHLNSRPADGSISFMFVLAI